MIRKINPNCSTAQFREFPGLVRCELEVLSLHALLLLRLFTFLIRLGDLIEPFSEIVTFKFVTTRTTRRKAMASISKIGLKLLK